MTRRVGIVGLGVMGRTHAAVMEALPGVELVAGVDVAAGAGVAFRGEAVPVYGDLEAMLCRHELDDVIVATPTATHADLCRALLGAGTGARVLVEKPLAIDRADGDEVLDRARAAGRELEVLYHFRFAPEVEWAARRMPDWVSSHGPVVALATSFADAYAEMPEARRAVYVSSWIDSGINALSLLDRLVTLEAAAVAPVAGAAHTHHARVRFSSGGRRGEGHVITSWQSHAGTKTTHLELADGAHLTLDHSGLIGWLAAPGATPPECQVPVQSSADRKSIRYHALLAAIFAGQSPSTTSLHRRLHRLLTASSGGDGY